MRALLISVPVVAVLAACQSSVPFEAVSDQCGSLGYLSKVGLKLEEAQESSFPAETRFIRPGTPTTKDYRAERLNVHINKQGRIEKIDCG
ncbi:MAG TPA: I78 family peptidase inhibitor [Burkholderiaceae bacterium]|nr:I78 family peptidase inhibitor [Burkholderiaceae bacterium]